MGGATPERVVLESRGEASALPPVRIFLATEPAQHRATRVFVWSVEQVRDPSRRYEITLLEELPGFDRRGWTTGFTNYRYAIPHLCGGAGRAIYNDVDQIYCADPAELFDLELGGHGWLAVAADDPSVMLIDCARMADVWTLERAQHGHKSQLQERARNRWGRLAPEWNARDDELPAGTEKCLHYTTLHTQPWRPFPERFAYQPNPRGDLWHALERSADAAGFQVFTRARPSDAYVRWHALQRSDPAAPVGDRGRVEPYVPPAPGSAPGLPAEEHVANAALCDLPRTDLPWVLDDLFASTERRVRLELPWDGSRRELEDWRDRLDAAALRARKVAWRLTLSAEDGRQQLREGGAWTREHEPSVWVLLDDRPGNATQSRGLAQALGWPVEEKQLAMALPSRLHNRLLGASLRGIDTARSSPLAAPWPDLVIAAGRRTAPVARWIQAQTAGRTRLVLLGRKGGDDADRFDLVVTPEYCRLPAHPRRIATQMPLHGITASALDAARSELAGRFEGYAAPRVALLVGGTSGQYRLDAATAARIGEQALDLARRSGGSLLVTTSRRVSPAACAALRRAVGADAFFHAWSADEAEANPYLGLLAWADAFVVTGDSESMLAEACSIGKPVYIAALPVRASFRLLSLGREWVWRRSRAKPGGPRGTPRPQRGLELASARAIERGLVRPSRDLDRLHAHLYERGIASPLSDGPDPTFRPTRVTDGRDVVARVRALMGTATGPDDASDAR